MNWEENKLDFDRNKIKLKIAISKIKEENDIVMESKKRNFLKVVATTMASVVLCSGVVFAGVKVYENINKKPVHKDIKVNSNLIILIFLMSFDGKLS